MPPQDRRAAPSGGPSHVRSKAAPLQAPDDNNALGGSDFSRHIPGQPPSILSRC